jgi:diguanylate cyclase (GGDEF)-like protein/PAS domain S-box-containing protein
MEGLFPVARAVGGHAGVTRFTDFLGHRVLAAYVPVADTGLGLVQKLDLRDVYASIGRRMFVLLGIPFALVCAGVMLLRIGVRPLIAHIVDAEREAHEGRARFEESEKRLRTITDSMPALISYIDRDHVFRFNNQRYSKWLRKPLSEITNRPIREVYGDAEYHQRLEPLERALKGETVNFEVMFPGSEGETRYARGTYIPDRRDHGEVRGVHGLILDVTEAKNAELVLMRAAHFDNLTGLPNRAHFTANLREFVSNPRLTVGSTALMFLDIDHFKAINDERGHQTGDDVLLEFADRLRRTIRPTDLVGRLGGDEFVIFLTDLHTTDEAGFVARKILAAMATPFEIAGRSFRVSTSIGIAIRRPEERDLSALLRRADEALYEAKAAGRDNFSVAT